MVRAKISKTSGYPDVITNLPEADVTFEGARAWILQAKSSQLVFFEFAAGMDLPSHSHTYVQWGMIIDGEMELKIAGVPRMCKKEMNTLFQQAQHIPQNSSNPPA